MYENGVAACYSNFRNLISGAATEWIGGFRSGIDLSPSSFACFNRPTAILILEEGNATNMYEAYRVAQIECNTFDQ